MLLAQQNENNQIMVSDRQRVGPPRRRGVVCVRYDNHLAKYNTTPITFQDPTTFVTDNLSSMFHQPIISNRHQLTSYVKYVLRVHLASTLDQISSVGTMFPISPCHLATAYHVTDNAQKFFLTNEDVYPLARMLPTRQVHALPHFTYDDIMDIQDESVRHLVANDEDPVTRASMTLYGATITNCWTYHL